MAGSSAKGVVDVAEQGEDQAVKAYMRALDEDISTDLRVVVERQHGEIKAAHDQVRSLQSTLTD